MQGCEPIPWRVQVGSGFEQCRCHGWIHVHCRMVYGEFALMVGCVELGAQLKQGRNDLRVRI